jgi:hypothetical protein
MPLCEHAISIVLNANDLQAHQADDGCLDPSG